MARRLFHKKKPFPLWASLGLLIAGLGFGYFLLPERAPSPDRNETVAITTEAERERQFSSLPQAAPQPSPQPMGFGADQLDRPGMGRGAAPGATTNAPTPPAVGTTEQHTLNNPLAPSTGGAGPAPTPSSNAQSTAPQGSVAGEVPQPATTAGQASKPGASPAPAPLPAPTLPPPPVGGNAASAPTTAPEASNPTTGPQPIAAEPGLLASGGAASAASGATSGVLPKPIARQNPPPPPAPRGQAHSTEADTAASAAGQETAPAVTTPTPQAPVSVAASPPVPPPVQPTLSSPASPSPAPAAEAAGLSAPSTETAEPTPAKVKRGTRPARVQLTSAVRDREPVDSLESVTSGQTVYGFSEIRGLAGHSVEHRWERDGRVVSSMHLKIGGDRWRVHSRKPSVPGDKGVWDFIVLDDEGNVLGQAQFVVQ